jgi:hypothetical protein
LLFSWAIEELEPPIRTAKSEAIASKLGDISIVAPIAVASSEVTFEEEAGFVALASVEQVLSHELG